MILGLGTAAIGRPQYINIRESQHNEAFHKEQFVAAGKEILTEAYNKGIRHFDTAPGYGIAEEIILEWLQENKGYGLTISTKWGYTYVANFDPFAPVHEVKEHSIAKLEEQWLYSSNLLPHLSLYQIHSATLDSGVLDNEEILLRLLDIKQQHGIEIGLSTSGPEQNEIIEKALTIQYNGEDLFDSFQVTFNVFEQRLLELNETLHAREKKIIVKEALANGRVFPNENFPHYNETYELLRKVAKKNQVDIDAVALRFCEELLRPHMVLSGTTSKVQLESNMEWQDVYFSTSELNDFEQLAVDSTEYWNERKQLPWN